jgi:DNA-directed RNA polymerase I subunit RPA2
VPRVLGDMDPGGRWRSLPSGPSLKHLTDPSYGIPKEQQQAALQDLTRAHVDSFNYAVHEGLSHAVQVSAASSQDRSCRAMRVD